MIKGVSITRKERNTQYYCNHQEEVLEKSKEYYYKNREQQLKVGKKYSNSQLGKEKRLKWKNNNSERLWAYGGLEKHKKRNFVIDMSIEQLVMLAKSTTLCLYCGVFLQYRNNAHGGRRDSATLDRKENGNSLSLENVQIICMRCNGTKHDRSHSEFIKYCVAISDKFNGGKL